jgi:hypothetical protein
VLDGIFSAGVAADFGYLPPNAARRVTSSRQSRLADIRLPPGGLDLLGDRGQAALLFEGGALTQERWVRACLFGRRIEALCPVGLRQQMSQPKAGELGEHLFSNGLLPQMLQLDGAAGLVGRALGRRPEAQLRLGEPGREAVPLRLEPGNLLADLLALFLEHSTLPKKLPLGTLKLLLPFLALGSGTDLDRANSSLDRSLMGLAFQLQARLQGLTLRLPAGVGLFKSRRMGRRRLRQRSL